LGSIRVTYTEHLFPRRRYKSDESLPSEQSGTQAFPIVISSPAAESSDSTESPATAESAHAESAAPVESFDSADPAVCEPSEASLLASELTPPQQLVLQQLSMGAGIKQASKATGVPRRTISRWVNENPKFIAAFNAWKIEQIESGRASALAMTDDVMAALRTGVQKGDTNIAFRMALKMGMLTTTPGPIEAGEVERRRRIRGAQVQDELSHAEYQHNLDLHDRAERQGIAWASWAPRGLTFREQSLLKFLRDKVAGRTNGALILFSKRQMFDMLRQAGVAEDQALQLLANYRRPHPGFYEPDDLPYAADEHETVAPAFEATDSAESEPPSTNA
jgi:hypothetical protein